MSEISKLKYEISVESNKQTTKDMSNESLQISSFDFQTPSKREQIYWHSEEKNINFNDWLYNNEFDHNHDKINSEDENKPILRKQKTTEEKSVQTSYLKTNSKFIYFCNFFIMII